MQSLFNVTHVRIYVLDKTQKLLLFVNDKSGKFEVQPSNFGIASTALMSRQTVSVPCAQNDPEYNRSLA
jgi:hypothetical protein